jgi:hypothetical protein
MSFTSNALQFKLFHNIYIYIYIYIYQCVRLVPEITVIGYAPSQKIRKPNKPDNHRNMRFNMSQKDGATIGT